MRYNKIEYKNGVLNPTVGHFHRFKESMHHTHQLLKGVKFDPLEEEAKEWCSLTY